MVPVVGLGIRSLTWLRVFGPTRYMITMVLQVFAEMAPFLVILTSVLFVYAYAWRLVGGLGLTEYTPELDFYSSVISSTNLIFGSGPDPLGDDSTPQFDLVKYLVYVTGNVVLSLVLLNFLIAVISGTHDRINENKELYDVKELLELINDLDLFLRRAGKDNENRRRETRTKFLILIREGEEESKLEEYFSALQEEVSELREQIKNLDLKFDSAIKSVAEEQTQNLKEFIQELLTKK